MRQYRFQSCILHLLATVFVILVWPERQATLALDPQKAIAQYNIDVWQGKDGLPQNTILAITQSLDGYLWLGTGAGLARFDGVRFAVFDNQNTPALKGDGITALHGSRDGSLWIGTRGGGLVRLHQSRFFAYTMENGLANDFVRAICEDRAGNIWIGTNNGLSRFRDGHFINYFERDGLPSKVVRAICEDRAGQLWIGTGDGLARWKDGKIDLYNTLSNDAVRTILEDRQGRLWVGASGGGLSLLGHDKSKVYTMSDKRPSSMS